jgi:replication factor A1
MAIKDLQPRMGNVELTATVSDKGAVREFNKFGKTGRVCNATLKDDTGTVSMTLWNDDVDKVEVGDKIQISNGWVGEYQGEMQLSTGKFGQLKVLEKSAAQPEKKSEQKKIKDDDDIEPLTDEESVDGDE